MDAQSPRSRGNVAYSRPSTAKKKFSSNYKKYAVRCVGVSRDCEEVSCIAGVCRTKPRATTPHARALFRIDYEGCRVWSGLCFRHVLGGYTP
jgi:hypothetical protein